MRRVMKNFSRTERASEMLAEEGRRGPSRETRPKARLRWEYNAARETNRELKGCPFLDTLLQDIRYGLRTLRRGAGFTSVAVLTLGWGRRPIRPFFSVIHAGAAEPASLRPSGADRTDLGEQSLRRVQPVCGFAA